MEKMNLADRGVTKGNDKFSPQLSEKIVGLADLYSYGSSCLYTVSPEPNMRMISPAKGPDCKWTITERDRRPLSAHPRQVTEYTGMASDTLKPEKRKSYYLRYGFDEQGNIVCRSTYMNDSLVMKRESQIDENGRQDHTVSIYSFPSDDEEVREDYDDSTSPDKRTGVVHKYYNGDRMVRATAAAADGSSVEEGNCVLNGWQEAN